MVLAQKKVRALGLCSGGLDSILSGIVLREQGIDVEWISFETPFFSADKSKKASQMTGIPLTVKNITSRYLKMLKNPRCGYGQNMNPCLDCHALMFRIAGEIMQEKGFDFLFSGEVAGQRPMSQTKSSLRYVEKNSGFDGYIIRPLSIKNLPETRVEKQGLVDREKLYGITGRSRKTQMELAKKFGITDYPHPGGGCLLTDKSYTMRLKDVFRYQEKYTENELHLLKYGRHFRLNPQTKIIVGRDKKDNDIIFRYYNPKKDVFIETLTVPAPVVLILGGAKKDIVLTAASIAAGYGKAPNNELTDVLISTPKGRETAQVNGISPRQIKHFMI